MPSVVPSALDVKHVEIRGVKISILSSIAMLSFVILYQFDFEVIQIFESFFFFKKNHNISNKTHYLTPDILNNFMIIF